MTTGTKGLGQATKTEQPRGVFNSVGMINCVGSGSVRNALLFFAHEKKKKTKELSLCYCGSGLACRFSSPRVLAVLAVISKIIPPSVICALSWPMNLWLDLKDWATKCISVIVIAWTLTTITIKNPGDHQTYTWNLLWLDFASFGLKDWFGEFTGPVNQDSSRNQLSLYGVLSQGKLLWLWMVFPEGGPC